MGSVCVFFHLDSAVSVFVVLRDFYSRKAAFHTFSPLFTRFHQFFHEEQLEVLKEVRAEDVQSEHQRRDPFRIFVFFGLNIVVQSLSFFLSFFRSFA